jgi:hypothetical protein
MRVIAAIPFQSGSVAVLLLFRHEAPLPRCRAAAQMSQETDESGAAHPRINVVSRTN